MLAALALLASGAGAPAQAQAQTERDDGIGAAPETPAPAPTPPSALTPPPSPEPKPGCRDSGVKVSFESGSSELDINARGALNGVATWLKMRNGRSIEVPGLGSAKAKKGSAASRGKVGERRATAIRDYLLGQGIEPERIGAVKDTGEAASRAHASGRTVPVLTCDVPVTVGDETNGALEMPAPPAIPPMATLPRMGAPAPAASRPAPEPSAVEPPAAPPGPPVGVVPPPVGVVPPPVGVVPPPVGVVPPPVAPPEPVVIAPPAVAPPVPPPAPPPPIAAPPVRFVASPLLEPEPIAATPRVVSDRPSGGLGVQATVGGGVIGFVDSGARAFTNPGGSWEARMTFGSHIPIAFEAAYVGSAQGIVALGLSQNAILLGNGGEATLRINFTTSRIQPYLFGGGGFTRYQVTNAAVNASSVRSSDDVATVPTGVGISARLSRVLFVDVRGTYRFTFDDQLFATASALSGAGNGGLDSWNAIGRLGFEL
jgi:outer membrane protein OmpA-like peptidoglycan-associated protein